MSDLVIIKKNEPVTTENIKDKWKMLLPTKHINFSESLLLALAVISLVVYQRKDN